MSAWRDREGLLILFVGIMLITAVVVAVLAFAPFTSFEIEENRSVSSVAPSNELLLTVSADVCDIELRFSEMEGTSVMISLNIGGKRGALTSDPEVNLTVEQASAGERAIVDVSLKMDSSPTVQYQDPRMLITIDPGLMTSLDVTSNVGGISLSVPSDTTLDNVSLFAKVGSVQADLLEWSEVQGDVLLSSRVGSVSLSASNATLGDGIEVNMSASTGSLYLDLERSNYGVGNATFALDAGTGSVYLGLSISGSTSAEIISQTDVGGIDTDLVGFGGEDAYLTSNNHPDVFELSIFLKVGIGKISIVAEWSE